MTIQLSDITFDESDRNLFQVDDARLRADALKHSILPRLHVVLNEALALIKEIYGVEALEDSIVSQSPNFRQRRQNDLKLKYEWAGVGLGGKRATGRWHGFAKKNGKPVQIVPFLYSIFLSMRGLEIYLNGSWGGKGLTQGWYKSILDFHLKHEALIHSLCYYAGMNPICYYDTRPISTLQDRCKFMLQNELYFYDFETIPISYPLSADKVVQACRIYVIFYPIYDSYIQIAMGNKPRFEELIQELNRRIVATAEEDESASKIEPTSTPLRKAVQEAREAAEKRVRVMPAMRWQVFMRDNWKCVACGRGASDGIILHIDHILPRSKGGKNTVNNYQTLCHECNIGKSNQDATDLRKGKDKSTLRPL